MKSYWPHYECNIYKHGVLHTPISIHNFGVPLFKNTVHHASYTDYIKFVQRKANAFVNLYDDRTVVRLQVSDRVHRQVLNVTVTASKHRFHSLPIHCPQLRDEISDKTTSPLCKSWDHFISCSKPGCVQYPETRQQKPQGNISIGQGTNSASRLLSTLLVCIASVLMIRREASTSSATSPMAALQEGAPTWSTTSKLLQPCSFSDLHRYLRKNIYHNLNVYITPSSA